MKTNQTRREFLDYFRSKNHTIVPSSPVIPHDDPTLLFTNAGMNQFKDVFLGKASRPYSRATTSQKCIRAGGKHNDLENVGHTKRHLTFFEMLGNFSFGDYFKEEAITFAWDVSTRVFGFPAERIWPTIFRDDDEAFSLWTRFVPKERITRFGEKDNFWAMGDVGPCGPCSELLFDRGPAFGRAENPLEDPSGERFLEFWNLVFMQYNRSSDGTLVGLPKPSIDTGAGLERVMSLIEGTDTVFETDILRDLITAIEEVAKIPYDPKDEKRAPAFRVIADHIRSLSFAIADGGTPSNIERGYVLRKILRRAVRYGRILGFREPFLAKLSPWVSRLMGQDYKELTVAEARIAEILTREEEAFFKTLARGGNMLSQVIESAKTAAYQISGADAFRLKDTYGLPLEEILLIAKDNDLTLDIAEFETLEDEAREKSRQAQKTVHQLIEKSVFESFSETTFLRDKVEFLESSVLGIIFQGESVKALKAGQEGLVILSETLFYPEMGGQVGDTGMLATETAYFEVTDCKSPHKGIIAHIGKLAKGELHVGDTVRGSIDRERRVHIENNHTATHLLHWALHTVLGEAARQAGSLVAPDRFRFDFSHHKQLTAEEIRALEQLVNAKIRENVPVENYEIPYEEATQRHDIKQFFGEKYGARVRVVDTGFSKELCGGTHTSQTGNIGYFRIARETSIAAGVRRIEALTGKEACDFAYCSEDLLHEACTKLKTPQHKLLERLDALSDEMKGLQNEVKSLKGAELGRLATTLSSTLSKNGIPFVATEVALPAGELRSFGDTVSARFPTAVIAIGIIEAGRAHLLIKVSRDLVAKGISANKLLQTLLPLIEGNGGGKEDSAQGAGKNIPALKRALASLGQIL
jgi:alanyl-tRNA synthetase